MIFFYTLRHLKGTCINSQLYTHAYKNPDPNAYSTVRVCTQVCMIVDGGLRKSYKSLVKTRDGTCVYKANYIQHFRYTTVSTGLRCDRDMTSCYTEIMSLFLSLQIQIYEKTQWLNRLGLITLFMRLRLFPRTVVSAKLTQQVSLRVTVRTRHSAKA